MTTTVADMDPGVAVEDVFDLDVRVIEDNWPRYQGRCDTSNGCAPTCASACTNSNT